jgi:uncharacterized protein (UPF0264 family)
MLTYADVCYVYAGEAAQLITAGADASVHVHNCKDGSLTASFQKLIECPKVPAC